MLESENHECPTCNNVNISPDTLLPNRYLRTAVFRFKGNSNESVAAAVKPSNTINLKSQQGQPILNNKLVFNFKQPVFPSNDATSSTTTATIQKSEDLLEPDQISVSNDQEDSLAEKESTVSVAFSPKDHTSELIETNSRVETCSDSGFEKDSQHRQDEQISAESNGDYSRTENGSHRGPHAAFELPLNSTSPKDQTSELIETVLRVETNSGSGFEKDPQHRQDEQISAESHGDYSRSENGLHRSPHADQHNSHEGMNSDCRENRR